MILEDIEQKSQIQLKLEQERMNLNLLRERVQKNSQLTNGMVGILSSFEHRLARLEQTILPVYNETENLQRCQENIDRTITLLDNVISYYGVSHDVESTVRAGPGFNTDGESNLQPFLNAMSKLQSAQEYFEKNNPQSVELENVTSIFNAGAVSLNKEFKEVLQKHSKPVAPIALLDIVSATEEESGPSSLNHFPEEVSSVLIKMADWLILNSNDDYMTVYAKVRANTVLKSLQNLKEQQKSASGGSLQGSSSPLPKAKFQSRHETNSRSKASRRLQNAFERKANKMFLKASQTLEQSTGLALGSRRSGANLEFREDIVDEQEMENYLICVMALQRLLQSERSLMIGIIPLNNQSKVFEIILRDAMDMIVQDGDNIATRAKHCINRRDFSAVLVIFPILKNLLNIRPEFEKIIEGCDIHVKSKYTSILNTLHSTGAKALEDFIESLHSESQLPSDGTVHEVTSNVLIFLEQLVDYTETIGGVLLQEPAYSHALNNLPNVTDKNKTLVGVYIKKVLAQLSHTLVSKSESYADSGLKAIFKLNNCHYVLRALQRSDLLILVKLSEADCEKSYLEMITEHKKAYANSWSKMLNYLNIGDETTNLVAGKMKDKDRNTIKEKFAGFNREFEDVSKQQRGYSIPDMDLRQTLIKHNKDLVLPKYKTFYSKFSHLPFTKNKEKYIKYTPQQVSEMLDKYFDIAA